MIPARLVLFTRFPEPGRAKTRLIPALGAAGAAKLHRRLTERALDVLRATGLPVELRITGAPADAFRAWLGDGVAFADQGAGDLGARMERAAASPPVVLVGADLPDLAPRHLHDAATALAAHDAVIGPAEDGGYYLLGLRTPMPWLFAPMAWGPDAVFAPTMARVAAPGVRPAPLNAKNFMDAEARHPAPAEVGVGDGGSTDNSVAIARAAGLRVVEYAARGRAIQINRGVQEASSPLVCVLHADTLLPDDAVAVIRTILADPGTALAGFIPLLSGADTVRWGTSFHSWIKTWYAPLIFRPGLFLRGGRLLFGDSAMFFRRAGFLAVGGCDPALLVMEDADLCVRLCRIGRVRMVNRVVITSDRRVATWGGLRANWIYLKVGVRWGLGLRKRLDRYYPDVR